MGFTSAYNRTRSYINRLERGGSPITVQDLEKIQQDMQVGFDGHDWEIVAIAQVVGDDLPRLVEGLHRLDIPIVYEFEGFLPDEPDDITD